MSDDEKLLLKVFDCLPSLFDLYTEEEMGYHDANALQKFRDAVRGYK